MKYLFYIHIGGKRELTDKEIEFLAAHSDFICLSYGLAADKYGSTEKGIENTAQKLKRLNPEIKLIFYWNSFLDYPLYDAHNEYMSHPEWWLKTTDGKLDLKNNELRRYDLSNPDVRNWYTNVAVKGTSGYCDGIFMDAFNQVHAEANIQLWGKEKYDLIQNGSFALFKETRQKIGDDKIILYNGIRNTPDVHFGKEYLPFADAVIIEHFDAFYSNSKNQWLRISAT